MEYYKLFLDDIRDVADCIKYCSDVSYYDQDWVTVRSYEDFVEVIMEAGLPQVISFDHDLADEHYGLMFTQDMTWDEYNLYDNREMTGYDCAKWLRDYVEKRGLKMPKILCHSMNPIGKENILNLFK